MKMIDDQCLVRLRTRVGAYRKMRTCRHFRLIRGGLAHHPVQSLKKYTSGASVDSSYSSGSARNVRMAGSEINISLHF